mmetsp:Transcript_26222/g.39313  ORF Transcript_26222/g.39313 Transcript_26222/m.39313 type:complete len:201 (+) Transcript_26222:151-753(+)
MSTVITDHHHCHPHHHHHQQNQNQKQKQKQHQSRYRYNNLVSTVITLASPHQYIPFVLDRSVLEFQKSLLRDEARAKAEATEAIQAEAEAEAYETEMESTRDETETATANTANTATAIGNKFKYNSNYHGTTFVSFSGGLRDELIPQHSSFLQQSKTTTTTTTSLNYPRDVVTMHPLASTTMSLSSVDVMDQTQTLPTLC